MVKANTPGLRDGRIAMWLDGALVADFQNLRLRDTTALKIDRFAIDLHAGSNRQSVARKWYDNVAATSYIGPMNGGMPLSRPETFAFLSLTRRQYSKDLCAFSACPASPALKNAESERHLDRQLHYPGIACARDRAEVCRAEGADRVGERRRVQQIEHFHT
jgi:hypothetical protein